MRNKVKLIAEELAKALGGIPGVECVLLEESSEADILDPYFRLILDAYHRGQVPSLEIRAAAYPRAQSLESAHGRNKDRFLIDGLPVHVEYKQVEAFESWIGSEETLRHAVSDGGTLGLYRLQHSKVLYSGNDWLAMARDAMANLGDGFWRELCFDHMAKLEHTLFDLGASVMRDDELFYAVSWGNFAAQAIALIFALNRRPEPPLRLASQKLRELKVIPDNFLGRWESLLRHEEKLDGPRRYEIAKLLAKSLSSLAATS